MSKGKHLPAGGYYQGSPAPSELLDTARYPRNHVRYPARLKPLEWLNALHMRMGFGLLSIEHAALAAYDNAAPHDKCLGSREELSQLRDLIALMTGGLDRNPFLLGIGRMLVKKSVINRLNARARVLEYYAANRAFIEAHGKLHAPLIITGGPRTGSTLLQRLLAEDPNARSPFTFEMETPLPPLANDKHPLSDPRIAQYDVLRMLSRTAPGFIEKFSESHHWSATECEESYTYMLGHHGLWILDVPNSGEACIRAFNEGPYHPLILRYERVFFTMLDAYRPAKSHWILKAPTYAPAFPHLLPAYPDARIVVTHRNPLITLPSVCRLFESWCIAFTRNDCFDRHRFAKSIAALLTPCFSVPFQWRRASPDQQGHIFDCMYDELVADPISTVKHIYRFFDLEVTPVFEERMRSYLHSNPQGKYGRHAYSLEDYAINAREFLHANHEYMNYYGFEA